MAKFLIDGTLRLTFVGLEVEADSAEEAKAYAENELGGSSLFDYVDTEDIEVETVESE